MTDRGLQSSDSHAGGARTGPWLGVLTVVMTLVGWSSVPLFLAHFSHAIDLWTSNGWRYGFAALLWLPWLVVGWLRGNAPAEGGGWGELWRAAVWPAVFNALGQTAFTWAFYNIDPATATFGMRMQIVFVAVGAYLLFPQERAVLRRPLAWLGMALVMAGLAGTVFLRDPAGDAATPVAGHFGAGFGMLMAVCAGLLFAGYGLAVRKSMAKFHAVTAFAAISQYTAIVIVALMLVLARDPVTKAIDFGASALQLSWGQFGLFLLSAVIGIALGHVFYYISLARLGVAVTTAVIQLQPFLVGVGQWMILDKYLTGAQWISGGVAVCGAGLMLWVQWRVSRARGRRVEIPLETVE